MGQLLSKDRGARAWKLATRSAATTPGSHGRIEEPRWRETAGKDVANFGGPVQGNEGDKICHLTPRS
jgi:hypothetical protein